MASSRSSPSSPQVSARPRREPLSSRRRLLRPNGIACASIPPLPNRHPDRGYCPEREIRLRKSTDLAENQVCVGSPYEGLRICRAGPNSRAWLSPGSERSYDCRDERSAPSLRRTIVRPGSTNSLLSFLCGAFITIKTTDFRARLRVQSTTRIHSVGGNLYWVGTGSSYRRKGRNRITLRSAQIPYAQGAVGVSNEQIRISVSICVSSSNHRPR